jgi:hypothetical protein
MEDYLSHIAQEFRNWGFNSVVSILFSVGFIVLSLPFTYVGYSFRKAIEFRVKKYQGYDIKKHQRHFLIGFIILIGVEAVFYLLFSQLIFLSVTILLSFLLIIGALGLKITIDLEELFEFE